MRLDALTDMQLDALTEVSSIGAGHAATALSQLVDRKIDLKVPQLQHLSVNEIPTLFGGAESLVAAAYVRLLGDVPGSMLFVAARDTALRLMDLLHNRPGGTTHSLGEEEEATILHAASILVSSYLAAVGRLTDLTLLPGHPAFAFDMVGAVLEVVAVEAGMKADDALLLRTEFVSADRDERESLDAYLFLVPDPEGLDMLLGRLGVL